MNRMIASRFALANTVAPAITGTAETGETVTCDTGTWTGNEPITYGYQWKRVGVNIAGETAATYLLDAADEDLAITCLVTATNPVGSSTRVSNTITPAAP